MKTFFLYLLLITQLAHAQKLRTVWLDDLPIQTYSEGLRPVIAKKSYGKDTLRINGVPYQRGIGAQSPCVLSFLLSKKATRFRALVGHDDQGNKNIALRFFVVADGKVLFESGRMPFGSAPIPVDINLNGVERLGLLVTDSVGGVANKRTYCNWVDARLEMQGLPEHFPNNDPAYILTPAPPKQPRIHSPKVFGARPGHPFLYTIAATGERPMTFSASALPAGLKLNPKNGQITGSISGRGQYTVTLSASNKLGTSSRKLLIKIGDTIALTPPIGWNGWNSWADDIDQQKVIASANAMVEKGLSNHGWSYINIDDTWQGVRTGPDSALQPNAKFPDIKKMADHIHALGLKVGLYSTPYVSSYAGYVGASSDLPAGGETMEQVKANNQFYHHIGPYKFERQDARQMARWGIDFLKYDWRIDVPSTERMASALRNSGRDIVLSISNNAPFEKVNDWVRLTNMFRTGPDIKDSWTSLYHTSFTLDKWAPYNGPGHWMDPDMMILGNVSIGPEMHPTRLTPNEQYSHVSIFSLLAAPMLIGCPIEQLDDFTLNLLSNDEVIAVNQDPLGLSARLKSDADGVQVWVKKLEDGSFAVGLFNIDGYGTTPESYFRWGNEKDRSFRFDFSSAGLQGPFQLRDLWRQKDLGTFDGSFATSIPHHGVVMLKMTPVPASIPTVAGTSARRQLLLQQWQAFQQRTIAVRDCFLLLLDGLDADFLSTAQVETIIEALHERILDDRSSPAYGAMFWDWKESAKQASDGNNVQFCLQYGMPIKFLFDHKLSAKARASLDSLFLKASNAVRNQPVKITYTNIMLMKIWNTLALGQVYKNETFTKEGKALFAQWLERLAMYGNREYDSPTYMGVDIESLLLMIRFSNDPDIRNMAHDALTFFMNDVAAHYNPPGGYLAGAHSRAYNRVFPRDLLEEKYINPLIGRPNNNIQLFHQLSASTLQEIGLTPAQRELMNRPNRFVLQRWDSTANSYSSHFVGRKFSIASSNKSYSPDDKAFAIYLSSKRIPEMLNITYVMEGRDDHYGTWAAEGKGEKLKHLMPANYPPTGGGWEKARHLMIFQQAAQQKNEVVFLAAGQKDHNCINEYLNSTIVLPNTFDEIWLGNKKIDVPAIGKSAALENTPVFFGRFEDVVVAIRLLWSDVPSATKMQLYNDGFAYTPHREQFKLTHNKGLRITLRHAPDGNGAVAMWWKVAEGIRTDAEFATFRNQIMKTPVQVKSANGMIDVSVQSSIGKIGVRGDLMQKQAIDYYHPVALPKDYLFQVDGVEIGKPVLSKYLLNK